MDHAPLDEVLRKLNITDDEFNVITDPIKTSVLEALLSIGSHAPVRELRRRTDMEKAFRRKVGRQLLHYHLSMLVKRGYVGKAGDYYFAKPLAKQLIDKKRNLQKEIGPFIDL